ncbi:MAG: hypothetical protein ACYC99_01275 [Candidatus Geothermincolia bacterium]
MIGWIFLAFSVVWLPAFISHILIRGMKGTLTLSLVLGYMIAVFSMFAMCFYLYRFWLLGTMFLIIFTLIAWSSFRAESRQFESRHGFPLYLTRAQLKDPVYLKNHRVEMLIYHSGQRYSSAKKKLKLLQEALDIDPTNERTVQLIQEEKERQKGEADAHEGKRSGTDHPGVSESRKGWVVARISGTCLVIASASLFATTVFLSKWHVKHPAWIFWVVGGIFLCAFLVLELVSRKKTPDMFRD